MEPLSAHFREFSQQCQLDFFVNCDVPNVGVISENITATRQCTDTIESLIQHIKNKIRKILLDKYAGKDFEVPVFMKKNNKSIKDSMKLNDFLQSLLLDGTQVIFKIFDQEYTVLYNTPLIREIKLPAVVYANNSIGPLKVNAIHTDKNHSEYTWYKSLDKLNWTEVGSEIRYDVTLDDIGYYLKLSCVPYNKQHKIGTAYEVVTQNPIIFLSQLPVCPFEKRHILTQQKLKGRGFRIVSYNILAERYTAIDANFAYCEPMYISMDYRKKLLEKELLGYNADIICLQEVDNKHYTNFFKQLFRDNYLCFYHRKGNRIPEGLACFANRNRFKKIDSKQIVFAQEIEQKPYAYAMNYLKRNKDLKEEFMKQSTSLQITVLKSKEINKYLIVANTHLYYHPEADHIRLLQVNLATSYLNILKQRYQRNNWDVSVIFCGDFNSNHDKSLYPYMINATIDGNHPDCVKISDKGTANLFHNFILESACGTPKYTNYTSEFKACLDYVFIERRKLGVRKVIPLIEEQELCQHEGLPNKYFPSDHLALVVDLEFK